MIDTQKSLLANIETKLKLVDEGKVDLKGSLSKVWLGVPLKIGEQVTGIIAVQSYTDEFAYTESDKELLEFIAGQISVSIERKKNEQNLKLALEQANESDRLKSAFLATMSHELRTPLNSIIGFSDIIDKETSIDEILFYLKNINKSGNQLLEIVENLFEITLLQSGQAVVNNSNILFGSLIEDVSLFIEAERIKLNKENIKVKTNIPEKILNSIFYTDHYKLKQILINLLKNALKFTDQGSIELSINKIDGRKPQMFEFKVADTGIGISESKQAHIFELFRQADDTYTRTYGGTGVGLSIAKKLTELMGGAIDVKSILGKGTTFTITLPLLKPEDDSLETGTLEPSHRSEHATILIAEDDKMSYEYLKDVLGKSNFKIMWAQNGQEVVDLVKQNTNIDLILMDINMPVLNGYETTKIVKSLNPNIPVISQTAHAIIGDREKSINAGCDDYISKPVKKDLLIRMIDKHLSIQNSL